MQPAAVYTQPLRSELVRTFVCGRGEGDVRLPLYFENHKARLRHIGEGVAGRRSIGWKVEPQVSTAYYLKRDSSYKHTL